MCVCAQLCPTLCDPLNCNLPGFSVHGISQARILERVAISSSRGSPEPGIEPTSLCIFCIGRWVLYHCTTQVAQNFKMFYIKEKATFPQSSFTVPPCSANCLLDQMISRTSSCCSVLQGTWDLELNQVQASRTP